MPVVSVLKNLQQALSKMNGFMKKWIQPAAFLMATLWLVSCSPKISKIEYEKQTYELQQLQKRLELLQKNQEKESYYASTGNTEKGINTTTSNQKELSELNLQYSLLQQKYTALQEAYDKLKGEKTTTNTIQGVSVLEYNDLKNKYEALQKDYKSLEDQYSYMAANVDKKSTATGTKKKKKGKKAKKSKMAKTKKRYKVTKEKAVETPKVVKTNKVQKAEKTTGTTAPTIGEVLVEEEDAGTKQEWVHATKTSNVEANLDNLYFSYKNFERQADRLVLEVRIANRGSKSKMKWASENIQLIDNAGRIFEAKDYRIGKTYASRVTGKMTKRLKQDYTIQAVFAFEGIEPTIDMIKALRLIVELNGKNTVVEFSNIELKALKRSFNIEF